MDVPADRPAAAPAANIAAVKPTYITWLTLAFMTTASVASLRSAPTMAVYGLACVFLYIVPAIIFLLPQSLVAAELASGWSGGVFRWVSEGLGAKWGLLAVWCQFAMTIFYYPTLLGFVASTLAYVFNPELANNGVYTGIVIVVVFWAGVFLSARGGTGGIAKLASSGLVVGTLIPGALLVILGVVYLLQGETSAAPMNADHLIPQWTGIASLVLIVNNFLSYSGMEMNAVHVGSLRNPKTEFPRAMFFASGLVLVIFILPALAISWVIPAEELSLTAGVMQAFDAFFAYFNLQKLVPIVAIALVCASAGGMLTWLVGPVEGPAADRAARGLPAAVLPAAERERGRGQHPRGPGRGHDRDRAALRAGPVGVERLLDPQRDDDAGLPDRLPADVRRRASTCAATSPTWNADTARRRSRSCASSASWPRRRRS